MPPRHASIPLPNRGAGAAHRAMVQPAFAAPVRWTLIVLSWLAFGVASYLAYHSATGASVAGCGGAGRSGCDVVLSSSWSKFMGVPIAALGLACYATLATLSVLLGWRDAEVNRKITTAFVALAIVAAVASLWFIGVQVFAIGAYCKFCLVTDACGILIGIFAVAASVQSVIVGRGLSPKRALQPAAVALRPATAPAAAGVSPTAAAVALPASTPSLAIAFASAAPLLFVLIGGQLLFRGKTYQLDQTALNAPIKMDDPAGDSAATNGGTEHTALRVPDPLEGNESPQNDAVATDDSGRQLEDQRSTDETAAESDNVPKSDAAQKADPPSAEPQRERIVSLLGGKLTLNTYQHPIIGSPEAPHIVVEMVSYDCPHCRKMHALMHKALERYGDQVAVVVMPVPLEKSCNKFVLQETASHVGACGTARRACGVARLNPKAFVKFHDFLMSGGDEPPPMEKIVPKANALVDREDLRQIIGSPEVKKQIEGYVELFGQLQSRSRDKAKFGLPVQILGDQVMSGSIENLDDVYKAWEKFLGVKPL